MNTNEMQTAAAALAEMIRPHLAGHELTEANLTAAVVAAQYQSGTDLERRLRVKEALTAALMGTYDEFRAEAAR